MRKSTHNTVWNPRGDNKDPHPPYGLLGEDRSKCQSPSLRLEKYVRLGDNSKKDEIDAVVKCHMTHAKPIPLLEPKGCVPFVAKLRSRLIVNQAGGILENAGLCLHPHFGAPYIPGSAVKGIARHAAWCKWKEVWCQWEEAKKSGGDEAKVTHYGTEAKKIAKQIAEVFGYPTGDKDGLDTFLVEHGDWKNKSASGSVAFLPAIPCSEKGVPDKGKLAVDIVNSHQKAYYGNSDPAAYASAMDEPNPQKFPAVGNETSFRFALVPVRDKSEFVGLAKQWLLDALETHGAGAKTAAGYGWFDVDHVRNEETDKQRKEQEKIASEKANDFRDRLKEFSTQDYLSADRRGRLEVLFAEISEAGIPDSKLVPEYSKAKSIYEMSKQVDANKPSPAVTSSPARKEANQAQGLPDVLEHYETPDAFVLAEIFPFSDSTCGEERRKSTIEKIVASVSGDAIHEGWNRVKSRDKDQIAAIKRTDGTPIARKEKRGIDASVGKMLEWAEQHQIELP